jgi:serine/threonine-protein kinase
VQEASRAQALQDFVVGLFEQAGTFKSDGPVDVRMLLDAGEARGARELVRQPGARAELFGVLARLRRGLGDYNQALSLLQRQADIVEMLGDDAPPSQRLESATGHGRALRLLGREGECIGVMEPLQSLASREQEQLPAQASEFYSQLGRCQRGTGRQAAARSMFQRSLGLRREALHDTAGVAENLADLASLHGDAGETALALRGYRNALAQLHDSVGDRDPLAIDLLRSLCSLERSQGEMAAAERDCRGALSMALELRGQQHPSTIDASRQLAAIHVDQGRFSEAETAFRASRDWLVAHLGAGHDAVARDDNSLAIIAWERGDTAAALALLDRSIAIRRQRRDPVALAGVLFNKAMVLHENHRDREALPLANEARLLRSARLGAQHPLVGDALRLLGEIDDALGDPKRALNELQEAVRLTREGYGAEHPHTHRAELALAMFQARRGDGAALLRLDALAALPQRDAEQLKLAWLARAGAASVRCHGAQRDQALASLRSLADALRSAQPEGGVVVREVAAVRAECG